MARQNPQINQMYALYYAPRSLKNYWRSKRLRQIVGHAARNIPLYKDLLAAQGVDVAQVRRASDLPLLPMITKTTFAGTSIDRFVDNSRHVGFVWFATSGSSGKPFSFIPGISGDPTYNDFISFRFLLWNGWQPWELSEVKIARIKMHDDHRENRFFISVHDFFSDPETSIARIAAFKPVVLESFPSVLLELARRVGANPSLPKISPRFAITMGEVLSSSARELIEQALGCEVYNRYSTEEMGTIGMECEQHDGFHLINDAVITEVTDDNGILVAPGERGRILLTDLTNFSMSFIRYDSGDTGSLMEGTCPCGNPSPRIRITGRHSASLFFGDRRIFHLECAAIFERLSGTILQYQVVKHSDPEVLIRLITARELTKAEELDMADAFRTIIGEVCVLFERVEKIEPPGMGKSQMIIDESASKL